MFRNTSTTPKTARCTTTPSPASLTSTTAGSSRRRSRIDSRTRRRQTAPVVDGSKGQGHPAPSTRRLLTTVPRGSSSVGSCSGSDNSGISGAGISASTRLVQSGRSSCVRSATIRMPSAIACCSSSAGGTGRPSTPPRTVPSRPRRRDYPPSMSRPTLHDVCRRRRRRFSDRRGRSLRSTTVREERQKFRRLSTVDRGIANAAGFCADVAATKLGVEVTPAAEVKDVKVGSVNVKVTVVETDSGRLQQLLSRAVLNYYYRC